MFKFRLHPLCEADGEIGASSASATPAPEGAPPSVAAGDNGSPAAGSAPAVSAPGSETPAQPDGTQLTTEPDVAQQASFAARLKEEKTKIAGEYEPHVQRSSRLEAVAKAAGFQTTEAYLDALDASVRAQTERQEAARLGVDEETYREFFAPVHNELNQTKQQLQTLQQADMVRQVQAEDTRLMSAYPDYKDVRDKVFDLAESRLMPLEDAYKIVAFEARQEAARLEGQNAAIAALSANSTTSTGAAGGDAPDQRFDITKLSREERATYFEKAKRGELKSLH